jgi:hypothetical protein
MGSCTEDRYPRVPSVEASDLSYCPFTPCCDYPPLERGELVGILNFRWWETLSTAAMIRIARDGQVVSGSSWLDYFWQEGQ